MSPPVNLLPQRLHTQHLAGPRLARPEDVVRFLGAVQAQDYPGARWSVGQRVTGSTAAGLDEVFSGGRILRTHILRPTWHFVAPEDIRWMLRLTAPGVHAVNAHRYRELDLDGAILSRCNRLIGRALEGGRQLTRPELAVVLRQGGVQAAGQRLAYAVMHAELEGLVCSGALRGRQHTYALLEERVPKPRAPSRDEALAELTHRFFVSHGPATLAHFVWWSGLKVADARAGLAMNENRLETLEVNGHTYRLGDVSQAPASEAETTAYLLSEFDEAILGYKDMAGLDPARADDGFDPPVVIGGRRLGAWRRRVGRNEVVVETKLFARLAAGQRRALEAATGRYSTFLGLPVTLDGVRSF
jgi:Winged helix DNA-binding domain